MKQRRILRTFGWMLVALGIATALGTFLVRDQFSRHRRNLFSAHPLRRLAALGYIAGHEPSVDVVQLLRDFITWEPRPLLRRRATQILERMERRLGGMTPPAPGEVAG
ncbi:MAG TPA: hypothetical protein VF188_08965 [Longimicrobiales bacterium]